MCCFERRCARVVVLLAAALLSTAHAQTETVSLIGGTSVLNGLLLVSNGAQNGSVCGRLFSDASASVVCRQLGLTGGVAVYGELAELAAVTPVLLNSVQCFGTEVVLGNCPQGPWGVNVCAQSEAVVVSCDPPILVRISGGDSYSTDPNEEVLFNPNWNCYGSETSLLNCGGAVWVPASACPSGLSARVACDAPAFRVWNDTTGEEVVLLGKLKPITGVLQVSMFNTWYSVCADSFNSTVANMCNSFELLDATVSNSTNSCALLPICGGTTPVSDFCGFPSVSEMRHTIQCSPTAGSFGIYRRGRVSLTALIVVCAIAAFALALVLTRLTVKYLVKRSKAREDRRLDAVYQAATAGKQLQYSDAHVDAEVPLDSDAVTPADEHADTETRPAGKSVRFAAEVVQSSGAKAKPARLPKLTSLQPGIGAGAGGEAASGAGAGAGGLVVTPAVATVNLALPATTYKALSASGLLNLQSLTILDRAAAAISDATQERDLLDAFNRVRLLADKGMHMQAGVFDRACETSRAAHAGLWNITVETSHRACRSILEVAAV